MILYRLHESSTFFCKCERCVLYVLRSDDVVIVAREVGTYGDGCSGMKT